jgi:DNA helicase HerA-like ATPase
MEPSATEKVHRDVTFFATLVRYAAWSPDEKRQAAFFDGMRSAVSVVRFGNRNFRHIEHRAFEEALGPEGVRRMVVERRAHRPGLMLTSEETATLVHFPNERTFAMFAEVEQRRGLEWTGPEVSADEGSTLGVNEYAGVTRFVRQPHEGRLSHSYIAGATGMGKSTLMKSLTLDDVRDLMGLAVIDPHGDLCLDLLSRLPEHRMKDLVYVSFAEPGYVPHWNPFVADVPSGKLADDITNAIAASMTTTFGPRMAHIFRNLAFVVHRLKGTFEDLADLVGRTVRGEELRIQALREIAIPEVQRFLREELPKYTAADLDSVRNKLSQLLLEESLGAMFRQPRNDLHPREWMDRGRVVLVNLSSGVVGAHHARFLGGLLVSLIHRAALTRAAVAPEERRPFLLYLDEVQVFQSASLEEILSEGRKYGLGTVLAHQEAGQLSKELVQALGNCGTRVIFRPSPDDVPHLKRALLGRVTDADLLSLGRGEAFVASGESVGSLRTDLCRYPVLRDGRQAAAQYARDHYHQIGEQTPPASDPGPRRKRTFDSLSKGKKT